MLNLIDLGYVWIVSGKFTAKLPQFDTFEMQMKLVGATICPITFTPHVWQLWGKFALYVSHLLLHLNTPPPPLLFSLLYFEAKSGADIE
jgi:hypothetical protein